MAAPGPVQYPDPLVQRSILTWTDLPSQSYHLAGQKGPGTDRGIERRNGCLMKAGHGHHQVGAGHQFKGQLPADMPTEVDASLGEHLNSQWVRPGSVRAPTDLGPS